VLVERRPILGDLQRLSLVVHEFLLRLAHELQPQSLIGRSEGAIDNAVAADFLNKKKLPNVDTGLHYEEIMKEFGLPSHVNTLIGEDKHRYV